MKNFEEIAEKVLSGELKGTFVLRNGCTRDSRLFTRNKNGIPETFPYYLVDCGTLTARGTSYETIDSEYDVIDFIIEDVVTMTEEEIKKRAELYARFSSCANNTAYYAYIEGARIRADEIEKLKKYIKLLQGMISDMHNAYFEYKGGE